MSVVAIPEPTSTTIDVVTTCDAIEQWAATETDLASLKDATSKMAAIDEYLARTTTEGRARVAATLRRLEVRIGQLLGPPAPGERTDLSLASEGSDEFTPNQRSDFRKMAEHSDAVEDAIDESTDERPASRRKVIGDIDYARKVAAELRESWPEGFDPVRDRELITQRGAFSRLCRDLAELGDGDPVAFIEDHAGFWRKDHLDFADQATAWLAGFQRSDKQMGTEP